ncbi:MAG: MFS transporter [Anaerolineaceae bacterium]|nr:MAG: MFS transporter [Anaerolineaceae bacterium]
MKKTSLTLVVFTLMNFVVTMTSLVFNGILDKVAITLNVSIANSGLLNSMYAYGAAFGVPITLILFRKIERTRMLKLMLFITILTTFALVFAQKFEQLLIVRLAMGISANSYGVLAISKVISISNKERQGRSMSFLIMGSSLSMVIGIPLARILTTLFDWRLIFWILNIIMIISLIYFMIYLPYEKISTKLDLKKELKFLKEGKTLSIIIYTFIMFLGYSALYTYVTPYLLLLFPSLEDMMGIILVIMGVASFIGNWIGGQAYDRIGFSKSMLIGAALQLVLTILIIVFQPLKWLSLICITLWVMSSWFAGLQPNTGIAQVTENKSSFIISINGSALQLGGAIGSSLAALVIPISGIQNLVYIAILSNLVITLLQIISNLKNT